MARLEVALEGWVRGGDRASSPRWADRKMPRSGVLAFNAAPGEETGGGGATRGGACAGRAGAAGQSGRRERAGARGEPREQRDPARGALSGAADRSPQPAGAAARPGPGSGGQDVRAGLAGLTSGLRKSFPAAAPRAGHQLTHPATLSRCWERGRLQSHRASHFSLLFPLAIVTSIFSRDFGL
ncbi:circumsporozoite protein-like [Lutra lutra]|uniref:circumsporozoite protein-like n=1 Tax=Lutra lutra TaxID=9657 RepID=UPI001FD5A7B3|nr:circumsporozoite protein-like [Lutra lutra]